MAGRLGGRAVVWCAALVTAVFLALAPGAPAQLPEPLPDLSPRDPGGFRNVLPGGQGETVNAAEFGLFQATGEPPDSFTDQLPLYEGLLYAAPDLSPPDLDRFFKPARFGLAREEVAPGGVEVPRPGVTILRDRTYQVPHVFGDSRRDTMFGAGYATAQDRLFLMDVLRHAGRARLTELIGPGDDNSTVRMDAEQLKIADYSERELEGMIQTAVAEAGTEGRLIERDLLAYVDGVNRYIREARANREKMPVEYEALGRPQGPEEWKPTDTVAVASLIGGIFGRGGGSEGLVSQALRAAEERFTDPEVAGEVFEDFRREEDPEAPVTTTRRFEFDDPPEGDRAGVAMPDLGSIEPRDPIVSSSTSSTATSAPTWLRDLQEHGLAFPGDQSNVLLIPGERSASGTPVAVMGPQVGYFSPQILLELDLHGGGIDARGATFPGISLYVLLGRGRNFAWSATTATTDNVDEFVEVLCEPDETREPTMRSRHYLYRGECIPFERRRHVIETGVIPADPEGSNQRYVLRVERSVHGPVQARATVDGKPVAIAEARSTYFHELESAVAFKRLNGNEVTGPQSFHRAMNTVNFAFNWFYADRDDVTFFQSGWFPRRARGTDPSLPALGTGDYDWRGFEPATFLSARMSFAELPKDSNPARGYIVNWNNKQAPGWRAADDQFSYGPVHRSERLEKRVRRALATGDGEVSLTDLTRIMELGATIDPRGQEIYPLLREVIGAVGPDSEAARLLAILDAWGEDGFHRRDLDRDNVLEHSPAVAIMDTWWPRLVRKMFQPALGRDLVERIRAVNDFGLPPPPGGSAFGSGWWGYVDKDLRTLLGQAVQQPLSRTYCGGDRHGDGSLEECRAILVETLEAAAARAEARYGTDVEDIERPATCERDPSYPRDCDQIEFVTAGAVPTDPMHWQDRPTFQQIVEVGGRRGGGGDGGGGGRDEARRPRDGGGAGDGPAPPGQGSPGAARDAEASTPGAGAGVRAGAARGLPFTGLPLAALVSLATVLLAAGELLRRRAR